MSAPPLDPQAPPAQFTYVRLTLRAWWENLPLVVLAGFLFMVPCAPVLWLFFHALFVEAIVVAVLLVVPAWLALLAQLDEVARDAPTHIRVMLKAWGHYWLRGLALGLLLASPALIAFLSLPALSGPSVPPVAWLGLAADSLMALVLLALAVYAAPLLVQHDMPLGTALRNSLVLASRHIWNTLGLLGLGVLWVLVTLYVHSGLIFFWPAFVGLFIVNNCRMVVDEEVIRGGHAAGQSVTGTG